LAIKKVLEDESQKDENERIFELVSAPEDAEMIFVDMTDFFHEMFYDMIRFEQGENKIVIYSLDHRKWTEEHFLISEFGSIEYEGIRNLKFQITHGLMRHILDIEIGKEINDRADKFQK
jgi:hypothetical protein